MTVLNFTHFDVWKAKNFLILTIPSSKSFLRDILRFDCLFTVFIFIFDPSNNFFGTLKFLKRTIKTCVKTGNLEKFEEGGKRELTSKKNWKKGRGMFGRGDNPENTWEKNRAKSLDKAHISYISFCLINKRNYYSNQERFIRSLYVNKPAEARGIVENIVARIPASSRGHFEIVIRG